MWSWTGVEHITFRGHTGIVVNIAFYPDDSKIASASTDGTGTTLTCRHSPREDVYAVAFSRKDDCIATGSTHKNIRFWGCETGKEVMQPLSLHRGLILFLLFSPDDETREWHLLSLKMTKFWFLHPRMVPFISGISQPRKWIVNHWWSSHKKLFLSSSHPAV
jgi:WD40 repeat protein